MPQRRATQSLVHTIGPTLRQPSLLGLEVLWRWAFGVPALLLVWRQALLIASLIPDETFTRLQAQMYDPMQASGILYVMGQTIAPAIWATTQWLLPLLVIWWAIFAGVGRLLVFRRMATLHPDLVPRKPAISQILPLVLLQIFRAVGLAIATAVTFFCIRWAAAVAFVDPQQPNLVFYFTAVIVSVLGMFTVWALLSWSLSVAPLLVVKRNAAVWVSLRDAVRLGRETTSQLVEINLVLGIIKLMTLVLAMVFSSVPIPFESATTPQELHVWWAIVTVAYFAANAFFQVVRQIAMLQALDWPAAVVSVK